MKSAYLSAPKAGLVFIRHRQEQDSEIVFEVGHALDR